MLEGVFSLFAMVHTMSFEGAAGWEETVPWGGERAGGGPFSYASMPCTGEAPVNNVSSDLPALGGAVPGSRVPVSMRTHPLRFDVAEAGGAVRLRGSITLVVCQLQPGSTATPEPVADGDKPRIEVSWEAAIDRRGRALVSWRGTFALAGGTGRYEPLRGEGEIGGYFFSYQPDREVFGDGQYAMIGRFRVPDDAATARGR